MSGQFSVDLLGSLFQGGTNQKSRKEAQKPQLAVQSKDYSSQESMLKDVTNRDTSAGISSSMLDLRSTKMNAQSKKFEHLVNNSSPSSPKRSLADSPSACITSQRASSQATRCYSRAIVTHIEQREYTRPGRRTTAMEKVLELDIISGAHDLNSDAFLNASLYYQAELHTGHTQGLALLRDEWLDTPVKSGDLIHLHGTWSWDASASSSTSQSASVHDSHGGNSYRDSFPDANLNAKTFSNLGSVNPSQQSLSTPNESDTQPITQRPQHLEQDQDEEQQLWDTLDDHLLQQIDDAAFSPQQQPSSSGVPTMIVASFGSDPETEHLLILHPDIIVSASGLASVASCMRRPMLQERIKTSSSTTYAAVFGNMVHGLLQASLIADTDANSETYSENAVKNPSVWQRIGDFRLEFLHQELDRQIAQHRAPLSIVGAKTEQVRADLQEVLPSLISIAERYLTANDNSPVQLDDSNCIDDQRVAHSVQLCITKVLGIEKEVVSPMYGLKGRIDVCVEAILTERGEQRRLVFPLEIKTGRRLSSTEHNAQTSLYTLLLSDAYGVRIDAGLLLYTQSSKISRVHRAIREVRSLLLARNQVANYKANLPLLKDQWLISSDEQTDESDEDVQQSQEQLGNLHISTDDHHWESLDKDLDTFDSFLQNSTATTPTSASHPCTTLVNSSASPELDEFQDLTPLDDLTDANIAQLLDSPSSNLPSSHHFLPPTIDSTHQCNRCYARDACMLYRSAVEHITDTDSPIAPLYAEHTQALTENDREFFQKFDALISHEEQHLAKHRKELWTISAEDRQQLGRCVTELQFDSNHSWVHLDSHRTLRTTFAVDDVVLLSTCSPHTAYLSRARVTNVDGPRIQLDTEQDWQEALQQLQKSTHTEHFTFRIDYDELSSMLSVPRYNVACLFYPSAPTYTQQLRDRVVHLTQPRFIDLNSKHCTLLAQYTTDCNHEQRKAIQQALSAQDYSLILGMPGTGKSTTIAALIQILVKSGQSVLLCSYTHSAVDTVVTKLDPSLDVLRLGAKSRVHVDAHRHTLDSRLRHDASLEEYHQLVADAQIVAATCLASNDALFQNRVFDVCIIDEASQITIPTCLGPLRFADRFVMIGDHHQLAPLVREKAAANRGLAQSLFQRLCEAWPEALSALTRQYRMNADIMALSNTLMYAGQLQCGNQAVAQATLSLDSFNCSFASWIEPLLSPSARIAFLNTDALPAREERRDGTLENAQEARIIGHLTSYFLRAGVAPKSIGILTPYRRQVRHLQSANPSVEVVTIDQAQGRDWHLVLVSMVRSNSEANAGSLLRETRRLNVMLTRAKQKLILVGSLATLQGDVHQRTRNAFNTRPLTRVLDLFDEMKAIYNIPKDALPTQPTPSPTTPGIRPTKHSPSKPRAIKSARMTHTLTTEILAEHDLYP
ncbi:DNA helicase [Malassezia yamatoensis]|uniref:DNA replication ATP-dependent helicase/nuclease DNA2 n=1 Tax=Malassezia yamatoensis TaxID=253288 RepID=A0AAJ5YVP6_9BASI|nr:DNA helicase [Malassezia yamatoensis]